LIVSARVRLPGVCARCVRLSLTGPATPEIYPLSLHDALPISKWRAMDISLLLDQLNDGQRNAVAANSRHQLVLAGAGSGKTRVLVHRIAWLLQVEGVSPFAVMAVTFTNKAAKEMNNRLEQLLSIPANGMWVGTFHGLAHRFLKLHWREARLPQNFQILDSDEQLRLIKRVMKEANIDDSRYPPKQ